MKFKITITASSGTTFQDYIDVPSRADAELWSKEKYPNCQSPRIEEANSAPSAHAQVPEQESETPRSDMNQPKTPTTMNKKTLITAGICAIVIAVFCHIAADHTMQDVRTRPNSYGNNGNDAVEATGMMKTVGTAIGVVGAALLIAGLVRKN